MWPRLKPMQEHRQGKSQSTPATPTRTAASKHPRRRVSSPAKPAAAPAQRSLARARVPRAESGSQASRRDAATGGVVRHAHLFVAVLGAARVEEYVTYACATWTAVCSRLGRARSSRLWRSATAYRGRWCLTNRVWPSPTPMPTGHRAADAVTG